MIKYLDIKFFTTMDNTSNNQISSDNTSDIEKIEVKIQPSDDIFAQQSNQVGIEEPSTNDDKAEEKKSSHPLKSSVLIANLLKVLIVVGLCLAIYLQVQLRPAMPYISTLAQQTADLRQSVILKQAEINKSNLLIASNSLNNFAFEAENYLSTLAALNSKIVTDNLKGKLKEKLPQIEKKLKNYTTQASGNLEQSDTLPLLAVIASAELKLDINDQTKNSLNEYKKELSASRNDSNKEEVQSEIQGVNNVLGLVGNSDIQAKLKAFNVVNISDKSVQDLLTLLYTTQKMPLSNINKIYSNKIDWSSIIKEIDLTTMDVDPLYRNAASQESIKYTNFQLEDLEGKDTVENKILVNGLVTTPNSVNFKIISDLIDGFENSALFKGVSMRSFNKKQNTDGLYVGNFNISFTLDNKK